MNKQTSLLSKVKGLYRFWLLAVLVLAVLFFGIAEPAFFKTKNLLNILSSACITAMVGIGLTCIMSSGEIDFSCGTQITFGSVAMALLMTRYGIANYSVAITVTIVLLLAFGAFNAFLHIKVGIPAFIATMGTSYMLLGFAKMLTNGRNVFGVSNSAYANYTFLGQGYLFGIVPMPAVVVIIIAIIMMIYTERTRSGKYLYAVGSNSNACKYIGIDANRQKLKGFLLCALLCGVAGIVQGSMLNGSTTSSGSSMLNTCLTVLMLGATFYRVGVYNIPGTIVAALLMTVVTNGMTMLSATPAAKNYVNSFILLLSVTLVSIIRKKSVRV